MKFIPLERIRATLKEHFPEWLSGFCYCGTEIPTYESWVDHVMFLMEHVEPQ